MKRLMANLKNRALKADSREAVALSANVEPFPVAAIAPATAKQTAANGSRRRFERVRHELKFRHTRVEQVEQLSTGFVKVTVAGDDLKGFPSQSFDDHIKVFVPQQHGEPLMRDYTPRAFDSQEGRLELEFAVHQGGAASDWAQTLEIGDAVQIGGPKGSMLIPQDFDWYLLVGDPTSLPAIHRFLDEAEQGTRVIAVIQTEHPTDQRIFNSRASLDTLWVADYETLLEQVRRLELPAGEGFVWGAGEGHCMSELRRIIVAEKQQPSDAVRISSYWKLGQQGFSEKG
ncbi:siderophore-interacting protein [Oceanobacter mangrovi]|uniref:siderophore-interacting protein n=1 Tax=Oceanobacter mangrovi TaxID=2862510 RepID=UPI001C8EAF05|nr:siderophore-interacting protein [Oceanobacter mangrovi]